MKCHPRGTTTYVSTLPSVVRCVALLPFTKTEKKTQDDDKENEERNEL